MLQLLTTVMQVENLIVLFTAAAAFGTIVTLASPYFENDKLAARTKLVANERDRLKAQQKAALEAGPVRLREKKSTGLYAQLVESLNLKKVFEAESSREMLRSAGLRSERHLTMFLAMRVIAPLVVATIVFIYCSTTFATTFSSAGMRVAMAMVGLVVGSYIPGVVVKNMATKRQKSLKSAWSDGLDLLLICVESGMALEPAMQRVAKEIGSQSVPLAEELQLTVAELAYLPDRRKALENLAKRTALETVKSVVTAMIQAERYGTPLGSALRVLAEENRKERLSEAEKKAAALPPKLTVPMILFFLPVIFVVILGPSIMLVMHAK
ncbi:MAG: type II secretion system F family protein [Alphaproteobacteria bacterium]|nr:type II secretion system F family protein [Alphaproteobacteria bacterium]